MNMIIICAVAVAVPVAGLAYEKAFKETKPGKSEIKIIPERTLIVAQGDENYFRRNNSLFGTLFSYIKANDVAMTVPVKADINPGRMYFYIGSRDLQKDLKNTASVKVVTEAERKVISRGVRGGYSEENFKEAHNQLVDELDRSDRWIKDGEAYAIYWNGPYVPAFMKRFEVHIPVKVVPM